MTPADVRIVLAHWPLLTAGAQITNVAPGFSGAAVHRITTATGEFALRGWPIGASSLPHERILELHRWLGSLAADGIATVAVPLPARSGDTLVVERRQLWQLESWLPGVADFSARPTDVRLRAACIELARWHRAAEIYAPSRGGTRWFCPAHGVPAAVTERLEKLRCLNTQRPRWEGEAPAEPQGQVDLHKLLDFENQPASTHRLAALLTGLAPRIAAELAEFASIRLPLHPCLRDVWHDHVLFTGDAVTGIIDASAARTENVASDLSRLLGSLLGDSFDRWETALSAYAAIRPLSAVERKLIRVLDRSGVVLSAAHWREHASRAPLTAREHARLQSLAQRLESWSAHDA